MRLFDPASGTVLMRSPAAGEGWWAGAPSVVRWRDETLFSYRLRAPRPRRGYALRIARLRGMANNEGDVEGLDDLGEIRADELGSASLERACLVAVGDALRLYISYVDPADGRWRIDVLDGPDPAALRADARAPALTAATARTEGVKDPVVVRGDGLWLMYASFTPRVAGADHTAGDVFATGIAKSCTGVAVSDDGMSWTWRGPVLVPPAAGWDAYETRISCLLRSDLALYDGIATPAENYRERTGLARRDTSGRWSSLTPAEPLLSARYVASDGSHFYYEYALPDGSHELRTAQATVAVEIESTGGR